MSIVFKVVRNFRIGREVFNVGDLYSGSDSSQLLNQKLIEALPEEVSSNHTEEALPSVAESVPSVPTSAEGASPAEEALDKKSKKKKAKG